MLAPGGQVNRTASLGVLGHVPRNRHVVPVSAVAQLAYGTSGPTGRVDAGHGPGSRSPCAWTGPELSAPASAASGGKRPGKSRFAMSKKIGTAAPPPNSPDL